MQVSEHHITNAMSTCCHCFVPKVQYSRAIHPVVAVKKNEEINLFWKEGGNLKSTDSVSVIRKFRLLSNAGSINTELLINSSQTPATETVIKITSNSYRSPSFSSPLSVQHLKLTLRTWRISAKLVPPCPRYICQSTRSNGQIKIEHQVPSENLPVDL